jgi:uncharacterized protein (UPF0548 family)
VFYLRRPAAAALARLVTAQSELGLTYPQAGATATTMPAGYRHDRWTLDLGEFDEAGLARGWATLRSWGVQRGAGLTVSAPGDLRPGLTFALCLRLPVGYVTAAGRVVYVTEEPERFGFAYGTLPAHPEQGEEAFHVGREASRLVFSVAAFSRSRHPAARLGAPVARLLQVRTTNAYLAAMRCDRPSRTVMTALNTC